VKQVLQMSPFRQQMKRLLWEDLAMPPNALMTKALQRLTQGLHLCERQSRQASQRPTHHLHGLLQPPQAAETLNLPGHQQHVAKGLWELLKNCTGGLGNAEVIGYSQMVRCL
jgi:hypothetical protein